MSQTSTNVRGRVKTRIDSWRPGGAGDHVQGVHEHRGRAGRPGGAGDHVQGVHEHRGGAGRPGGAQQKKSRRLMIIINAYIRGSYGDNWGILTGYRLKKLLTYGRLVYIISLVL